MASNSTLAHPIWLPRLQNRIAPNQYLRAKIYRIATRHVTAQPHVCIFCARARGFPASSSVEDANDDFQRQRKRQFWRPWELPPSKLSTTPQAFFLTPPPTLTTLPALTPQRYIKLLAPRQLNHSASTTGRRFAKPLTREEARQKTQPYVPKRTQQVGPGCFSTLGSIPQAVESAGCPEDLLEAAYPTHMLDPYAR